MASSRKPQRSAASASAGLLSHVAARLKPVVVRGERVVVGLSGGIDSVVLLDVLARLAPRIGFTVEALHINHGLSPNAKEWARFCRAYTRELGVRFRLTTVKIGKGNSVERAAREARYAAFRESRADHVALAHNQDDQAETLLLQLLRGAGVKGLSAMREVRHASHGTLLRPLLEVPRARIEAYAARRKLRWIEDESNDDTHYTRNWLRHELLPRIEARVPSYRGALERTARHAAEASVLLDDLARLDLEDARENESLRVEALRRLTRARAKNLLRFLIAANGWRMPDADRLEEALRQVLAARPDRNVAVGLGDCELRRHRGLVHLLAVSAKGREDLVVMWKGEREIALPGWGGVLTMARARGDGLSASRLRQSDVTIRARQGGERLQPQPGRPRRTVKNLLQEAGIPPWMRERLPFIYCGDRLACVPGVGVDCAFRAATGEPSIRAQWRETLRPTGKEA
jgi:tRNA(Ile)-lysidine synthase